MTIIAAPEGIHKIFKHYSKVTIVTSEIDAGITESGQVCIYVNDWAIGRRFVH